MNKWFLFVVMTVLLMIASTGAVASTHTDRKKPSSQKTQKTKVVATTYECPDCHDKFTLARAKKAGMNCVCCQAKLVAIKAPPKKGRK